MSKTSSRKLGNIFTWNVAALLLFGLLCLLSASMIIAKTQFHDPYYYVKQQLLKGVLLGALGFLIAVKIPWKVYKKMTPFLFVAGLILTILVFTPLGLELNGARRWLKIGSFTFQPNEIFKITFIMYLSLWLAQKTPAQRNSMGSVIAFIFFLGIAAAVMLPQPATSSFLILAASACIVYFLSGIKIRYILITILILALVLGGGFFLLKKLAPNDYRVQRLSNFISFNQEDGNKNLEDNYQLNQSLIAIGSGGITGVGFGNAVSKYNNYLPEPIGDSIFAVIAQEFGFIGSVLIIVLYLSLFLTGIRIGAQCPDEFGRLLCYGIVSLIFIQMFIHIGALTKIFPFTGQPLPLISYGGTNLAITLTSFGIVVNISRWS